MYVYMHAITMKIEGMDLKRARRDIWKEAEGGNQVTILQSQKNKRSHYEKKEFLIA